MNTQQTFWNLLEHHSIEIPIIQRDYAQGRTGKKIEQLRNEFIDTLIKMVINEKKTEYLDFIYGTIENGKLILLDGQQRLTTLFLLHWYIAKHSNEMSNEVKNRLRNFTYTTRVTSCEFCTALVEKGGNNELNLHKCTKLSKEIKESPWFFHAWNSDPTVKGMLVMLDTLHIKINELAIEKRKDLWKKLVSENNPPITFHFLNMDTFDLTDDLYIKMNSRGRPLTEFENFKAWLQGEVESNQYTFDTQDWKNSMDIAWMDIFWESKEEGTTEVDAAYLQYFKEIALSTIAETHKGNELSGTSEKKQKLISRLMESNGSFAWTKLSRHLKSILTNAFRILTLLQEKEHKKIDKCLEVITFYFDKDNEKTKNKSIFRQFCAKNPTYPTRVLFYALSAFLLKSKGNWNDHQLINWMQVIRNLVVNTAINEKNFARAVQSIKTVAKSLNNLDIRSYLADNNNPNFDFFLPEQMVEERLKSKLFAPDHAKWQNVLLKVENHPFFRGRISFLLTFCENDEGKHDIAKLEQYANKAMAIFDEKDGSFTNRNTIRRALITQDILNEGTPERYPFLVRHDGQRDRKSLGIDRSDWYTNFLSKPGINNLLKEVLDRVGTETKNLEEFIETQKNNCGNASTDWRKHFIECHDSVNYGKGMVFHYKDGRVFLIKNRDMTSSHSELHCFSLLKQNEKSFKELGVPLGLSAHGSIYAYGEKLKPGLNLVVFYKGKKKKFLLKIWLRNGTPLNANEIQRLAKDKYTKDLDFWYQYFNLEDVITELKKRVGLYKK